MDPFDAATAVHDLADPYRPSGSGGQFSVSESEGAIIAFFPSDPFLSSRIHAGALCGHAPAPERLVVPSSFHWQTLITMGMRSGEQEDYLIRIIKQAAEALRRLREKLTASATASPSIRQEVNSATEQLLGAQADMLARLDAETAVRLVGTWRQAQLWADLVELEAEACDVDGDSVAASVRRARAVALRAAIDRCQTKT